MSLLVKTSKWLFAYVKACVFFFSLWSMESVCLCALHSLSADRYGIRKEKQAPSGRSWELFKTKLQAKVKLKNGRDDDTGTMSVIKDKNIYINIWWNGFLSATEQIVSVSLWIVVCRRGRTLVMNQSGLLRRNGLWTMKSKGDTDNRQWGQSSTALLPVCKDRHSHWCMYTVPPEVCFWVCVCVCTDG